MTLQLVKSNWSIGSHAPIRALTVGVAGLLPADQVVEQLSFFDLSTGQTGATPARDRQEKLEAAVDLLRQKHGDKVIKLGIQKNDDIGL